LAFPPSRYAAKRPRRLASQVFQNVSGFPACGPRSRARAGRAARPALRRLASPGPRAAERHAGGGLTRAAR